MLGALRHKITILEASLLKESSVLITKRKQIKKSFTHHHLTHHRHTHNTHNIYPFVHLYSVFSYDAIGRSDTDKESEQVAVGSLPQMVL